MKCKEPRRLSGLFKIYWILRRFASQDEGLEGITPRRNSFYYYPLASNL